MITRTKFNKANFALFLISGLSLKPGEGCQFEMGPGAVPTEDELADMFAAGWRVNIFRKDDSTQVFVATYQ